MERTRYVYIAQERRPTTAHRTRLGSGSGAVCLSRSRRRLGSVPAHPMNSPSEANANGRNSGVGRTHGAHQLASSSFPSLEYATSVTRMRPLNQTLTIVSLAQLCKEKKKVLLILRLFSQFCLYTSKKYSACHKRSVHVVEK